MKTYSTSHRRLAREQAGEGQDHRGKAVTGSSNEWLKDVAGGSAASQARGELGWSCDPGPQRRSVKAQESRVLLDSTADICPPSDPCLTGQDAKEQGHLSPLGQVFILCHHLAEGTRRADHIPIRHLAGGLKAKLAKLKRELLTPTSGGGGGGGVGFDVARTGIASVGFM